MAAMAQLVYGSFIRVWREKESAVRESRLKRLLLHDASHQGTLSEALFTMPSGQTVANLNI